MPRSAGALSRKVRILRCFPRIRARPLLTTLDTTDMKAGQEGGQCRKAAPDRVRSDLPSLANRYATAASGPVPGRRRSSLDIEAENQPRKERFMSRSTFRLRIGVILALTAFVLGVSAAAALGWGGGGGGGGGSCCQKPQSEGKDQGNKPSGNEKDHGN